jgi:septum formation protein
MLILASSSPRRAELLLAAGFEFSVRVADVDETQLPGESPRDYVLRLSCVKAQAVARDEELVLGADTTVVINNEIAGKPVDEEDARKILRTLSGQWHEVLTAVTVLRGERVISDIASTLVKFSEMSEAEIDWYILTGEPMDKAGAYGIQGYASRFVERIEGNYSNVVGLPVEMVYRMIKRMKDEEGAGEREKKSGRAGERESGRAGERESGRAGDL